jgi:hypothetical protein
MSRSHGLPFIAVDASPEVILMLIDGNVFSIVLFLVAIALHSPQIPTFKNPAVAMRLRCVMTCVVKEM